VPRDEDAKREAEQQQEHQVVVLQPGPGRGAGAKPPARPVPQQCRGDAEQDCGPGKQVQRRGVADVRGADEDGSARHGEGGEHPAEPARAEQRREPGRRDHNPPAGQRGDDPDRRRADAEDAGDPGEQRDERRLVHVTECEMVPGDDEVQLVLLEAVAAAHGELDRHECGADHPRGCRHALGPGTPCRRRRCDRRAGGLGDRAAEWPGWLITMPPAACCREVPAGCRDTVANLN
jgi:hypothetical protein